MTQKPDEVERDLTGPMRELREYARGELDVAHSDVSHIAGLVDDPDLVELLLFAAAEYEPEGDMPPSFWDTQFASEILRTHATRNATRAIRDGDQSTAAYLTGVPSYEHDVSGLKSINQLSDWLLNSEQCKLIYCAALMGAGKTDFALLLLEIIDDHYHRIDKAVDESIPTPEFATNFSCEPPDRRADEVDVREIHHYRDLLKWAETGSSDDERWMVFDEASTELTAQSGANAQEVAEVFAPFVKKMRKMGINMIVIGHDRQDVHPAIRAVASFIDKTGLKTAEIYEGIKQREPYGHRLSISGIPQTSWSFDTDDVATWEWGDAVLDDLEQDTLDDRDDLISVDEWRSWRDQAIAATYYGSDLSQYDVADIFGIKQSTVSTVLKQFDDDLVEPAPSNPTALGD